MAREFHHADDPELYADLLAPISDREEASRYVHEERSEASRFNIQTPDYAIPNVRGNETNRQLNYGGLIRPNSFTGTTEPKNWLTEYEYIADANGWTTDGKFKRLVGYLEGNPRVWFFNERKKNPNFNWESFVQRFLDKYSNQCDKILVQTKISRVKQGKNESFDAYWDSKLQLIENSAPDMSTIDKMNHLFNGLEESLQNRVIEDFLREKPDSVEELYSLIKVKSDAINFITPKTNYTTPKERNTTKFEKRENKNFQSNQNKFQNFRGYQQQQRNPRYQNNFQTRSYQDNRDRQIDELIKTLSLNAAQTQRPRPAWRRDNWKSGNERSSADDNKAQTSRGETTQREEKTQYRPKRDMSQTQCYRCKGFGHFANNCTAKIDTVPKNLRRQD